SMVATGLDAMRGDRFCVHSAVHPWSGTFADVDRAARALATSLRASGVGVGDVVVCHLPNWAEAGITFWAAAYLGAVIVPVVHFYGAKELDYILRVTEPSVAISADRFGHADHLALYDGVLAREGRAGEPLWLVARSTADGSLPSRSRDFNSLLDAEPLAAP